MRWPLVLGWRRLAVLHPEGEVGAGGALEVVRLVRVLDAGPEHSLAVVLDVVVLVAGTSGPAEPAVPPMPGAFSWLSMCFDISFLKSLAPR